MKNPEYSIWYALEVIEGKFEEAEHIIMNNAESGYLYAKEILKCRWIEAIQLAE